MNPGVPAAQEPAVLCADDYAMTDGVSAAIEALAAQGRLSATSAMVTTRHWPGHAPRLKALSGKIGVGLHVNLTLGQPLGPMPKLAPAGTFPSLGGLLRGVLSRPGSTAEIAAEVARQIARFTESMGHVPDFVDGHQHVHALPGIRTGFLDAMASTFPRGRVLVRDPADHLLAILTRRVAVTKAASVAALAAGFGRAARAAGFPTNTSFAGFSKFDAATSYATELERFFVSPGALHLIMCHPGYVDAELRQLDPVVERRQQEFEAILNANWLPARIWTPGYPSTGGAVAALLGARLAP